MVGSTTFVDQQPLDTFSSSRAHDSSLGLLRSKRKAPSSVSKLYKHSSELFFTRRLPEAFSAIEPLVTVPPPSRNNDHEDQDEVREAPIAKASRKDRVRVWALFLTMLNAIADLGPEDGKATFGNKAWRDLVAKIQDSTIWEEVVNVGYGGVEGSVDSDVVISLATLLLAHASTQAANQHQLEGYLSAANNPRDFDEGLTRAESLNGHNDSTNQGTMGTDTPRELAARVSIVELYTLHVLPRNGEWDYARDFIKMSEVLDEDARDSFLHDLQNLEDEESKGEDDFDDASSQQQNLMPQEPQPADIGENDSFDTVRQSAPPDHRRSNSETDYGIETAKSPPIAARPKTPSMQPTTKPTAASQTKNPNSQPTRARRKATDPSVYQRSVTIMRNLQQVISKMAISLSQNPMGLLRFVLFLMGLIVAFSRRDIKDRVGRMTGVGWEKLRRTAGMGVKVSYI